MQWCLQTVTEESVDRPDSSRAKLHTQVATKKQLLGKLLGVALLSC